MAVRVLRLIEYVYENEQRMSDDMLRWTHNHKDATMQMRSAVLSPEAVEWVDQEERTFP